MAFARFVVVERKCVMVLPRRSSSPGSLDYVCRFDTVYRSETARERVVAETVVKHFYNITLNKNCILNKILVETTDCISV